MKHFFCGLLLLAFSMNSFAQTTFSPAANKWADSVFNTLNDDQRIAQLMVLRQSSFTKDGPVYYDDLITEMIDKYNIGGIVLFQGTPVKQANFINKYQALAKTPLMVCIDGEWGLGMRFDSVIALNHQMMMGAVQKESLIYEYGKLVGEQCKRIGIHVNYAPVVDINNNPANPVINDRSFGENKYKVADFGVAYMKGMQDVGVMACAKHFPGHGDVSVDSHYDLPVINKTMEELDSLELYPFKKMIEAGVGSIMIAHLYIPTIDNRPNRATSISKNNVTGLLRDQLHYDGLTFTDALNMKGVSKFFPGGEIAAESIIAGNDMLCLPEDVPEAIAKIREAIDNGRITWEDIYAKTRKVLLNKYKYGVADQKPIDLENLTKDLNAGVLMMNKKIAENAITILNNEDKEFFPLKSNRKGKVVYVGIGIPQENVFARKMKENFDADAFYFDYEEEAARILSTVELIRKRYETVVIGVHNFNRYPKNNFGISSYALDLIKQIQANNKTIIFNFGNPYALANFCDARNLMAAYEDDSVTHKAAIKILSGKIPATGTLPVTVCDKYHYGSGIIHTDLMPEVAPASLGVDASKLQAIDSIATAGIKAGAFPGAVILAAKDGKIFYEKAFGTYNYGSAEPVMTNSIFDMASVTKICATTISIMKLVDEGKVKLTGKLGNYLPWVRKSDKKNLTIEDILLHQAGLVSYIPFFQAYLDKEGKPLPTIFNPEKTNEFTVRVAENMYMRPDYIDTMYHRILTSKLGPKDKYIYSDNDFIFLGKIVEQVSGMNLDEYVTKNFYEPMGLHATGFHPLDKFDKDLIVPTEREKHFRNQHLVGDVHDPGAAMFGGIAGHAGLFSTAEDIAAIMQMLLDGGKFHGVQYLKPQTIKLFTAYNSSISRRGLGFDKPQKDNLTTTDKDPYPSRLASPLTFGHTGYTGTCTWADPKTGIVYVFLSNRVNPDGGENLKLSRMNIRGEIQDAIYKAITKP